MSGDRKILLRCLLILNLFCAGWALAAPAPGLPADELPTLADDAGLPTLTERLESIRQGVSEQVGDDELARLRLATLEVQRMAGERGDELQARLDRLSDQLNVLGPPVAGEAAALALQRTELNQQKAELQAQATQAAQILRSAQDLAAQIVNLRRSLFNSQIATRSAPPFSPVFWSTLTRPTEDDLARLRNLGDKLTASLEDTWHGARLPLLACLVAAVLLWIPGRRLLERFAGYLASHFIPEGRLRAVPGGLPRPPDGLPVLLVRAVRGHGRSVAGRGRNSERQRKPAEARGTGFTWLWFPSVSAGQTP